jgi:hypothetical protein
MTRFLSLLAISAASAFLLSACASPAQEVGKPVKRPTEITSKPAAKTAPAPAPVSAVDPKRKGPSAPVAAPSGKNATPSASDTATLPVINKKEMKPYTYNRVDSASLGSDLMLTRSRLLMEEDSTVRAGQDTGREADEARKTKVTQGYRIQVYATTDFKDAERKKEDLMATLEEPVYVIYEAPYYKLRVGNFTDEISAKNLKRKLTDMGYDA